MPQKMDKDDSKTLNLALLSLSEDWNYFPPINLVSLASYIKHKVKNLNVRIFESNFEDIDKSLENFRPHLIGITSMSIDYNHVLKRSISIKKRFDVPLIIGGSHITVLPESMSDIFDIGIVGEGEEAMLDLVNHFLKHGQFNKNSLSSITGIVYFNEGKLVKTGNRKLMDLRELPKFDWALINPNYFKATPENGYNRRAFLITSRGCPYKCVYCSASQYWRVYRCQSAEQVLAEIMDLYNNYGVRIIHFEDDLFSFNLVRVKEIIGLMKKNSLLGKVKFICNIRANLINDELLKYLKELGVILIGFGFESGSERYLAYLKVNSVTVKQNKDAILLCKKYNIDVAGSLMFGGPNETLDDMEKTLDFIDFCIKEKVVDLGVFVMTPFPGTEMWRIAKERGKVTDDMDDWGRLAFINDEDAFLLDDSIDKKKFKELLLRSRYKLRYFRKKRLLNLIKKHPIRIIGEAFRNPSYAFGAVSKIILGKFNVKKE